MRFLFIIQGERKSNLTQALALEEILIRNGHQVVEMLVGTSPDSKIPGFFNAASHSVIKRFIAPVSKYSMNEGSDDFKNKVLETLNNLPDYYKSMCYINNRIHKTKVDLVINFYELLTGLTYALFKPSSPYICIGHQYMFLHDDFMVPKNRRFSYSLLKIYARLTSIRAKKRIALSMRKFQNSETQKIIIVPPLIRKDITAIPSNSGEYLSGKIVDSEYYRNVMRYHWMNPHIKIHLLNNLSEVEDVDAVNDSLNIHPYTEEKLLNLLAGCKACINTGDFESICDAMYLGKPILMIPKNHDQFFCTTEAVKMGAGIFSNRFDIDELLSFSNQYSPNKEFIYWVHTCEGIILKELDKLLNKNVCDDVSDYSKCVSI